MIRTIFALALALGFLLPTGVVRAQDDKQKELERLDKQMMAAYEAREFDKAIAFGQEILKLRPDMNAIEYNLACIYGLKGDKAKSLEWLGRSADHGFTQVDLVRADTDLTVIKEEPAFKDVLEKIEANAKKAQDAIDAFKQKVEKNEPLFYVPEGINPHSRVALIVALHGYGRPPEEMVEWYKPVARSNGMILVVPRALRPIETRFHWGSVLETDMIVTHAVERATATYNIDPARIILSGFDEGGHMALRLGLKHPDKFCGVISVGAQYKGAPPEMPRETPTKWPRFYLMIGANDMFGGALAEENRKAAADLEARKVPVHLAVFPNVAHTFPPNRDEELNKAVEFVLTKE